MTEYLYTDYECDTLSIKPNDPEAEAWATTSKAGVAIPADRVEEVCAALREAAGLPPVWTVEKEHLDDDYDVTVREDGGVRDQGAVKLTPTAARLHAAQLLAAADEAEARAKRPKLPTAEDSAIKVGDNVWVRHDGNWYRPGPGSYRADDEYLAYGDFTVLYDPEKAS